MVVFAQHSSEGTILVPASQVTTDLNAKTITAAAIPARIINASADQPVSQYWVEITPAPVPLPFLVNIVRFTPTLATPRHAPTMPPAHPMELISPAVAFLVGLDKPAIPKSIDALQILAKIVETALPASTSLLAPAQPILLEFIVKPTLMSARSINATMVDIVSLDTAILHATALVDSWELNVNLMLILVLPVHAKMVLFALIPIILTLASVLVISMVQLAHKVSLLSFLTSSHFSLIN